jgi:hypothetical protein
LNSPSIKDRFILFNVFSWVFKNISTLAPALAQNYFYFEIIIFIFLKIKNSRKDKKTKNS